MTMVVYVYFWVHAMHRYLSYIHTNYAECVACHQLCSANLITMVVYVYFCLYDGEKKNSFAFQIIMYITMHKLIYEHKL